MGLERLLNGDLDGRPDRESNCWEAGMKRESNDYLNRSPTHLLHRAGQRAEDIFHAEMVGSLTPRQFAVLVAVGHREGISQTGIVDRTGIDRSTIADIVRRLKKKGLLERRRTREDARAYAVTLTTEGRRLLADVGPLAKRVDAHVLEALPSRDREQFLAALLLIVDALEGTRAGKSEA